MSNEFEKLAIDGGSSVFPDGPPTWPRSSDAVRQALEAVYESGAWGRYLGDHCEQLRQQMANYLRVPNVHLCCSGTFAVELALRALQVATGDEVILAAYDFPGNFRAIEDVGALPVLVDLIDDTRWCIDPSAVEEAITPNTRAVIVSHLHGSMADMPRLREIADRHQIAIVEDACQAHGGEIAGRPAGTWGDCGAWSFGGSKLLTAGRGGAMLTANGEIAQRAKVYCERGNDAYPLSELQAAVLVPQLGRLVVDSIARRDAVAEIASQIEATGANVELASPRSEFAAYYKLGMWYRGEAGAIDRFVAAARAEGLDLGRGFRGFHRRPESRCRKVGSLENAKRAAARTLVLHHPVLLEAADVVESVAYALAKVAHWLGSA